MVRMGHKSTQDKLDYMKRYYRQNRAKILLKREEYYLKNRDAILNRVRRYQKEHAQQRKLYLQQYYKRNIEREATSSKSLWQRLHRVEKPTITGLKRTPPKDSKCELCGNIPQHLDYHHYDDNDSKCMHTSKHFSSSILHTNSYSFTRHHLIILLGYGCFAPQYGHPSEAIGISLSHLTHFLRKPLGVPCMLKNLFSLLSMGANCLTILGLMGFAGM